VQAVLLCSYGEIIGVLAMCDSATCFANETHHLIGFASDIETRAIHLGFALEPEVEDESEADSTVTCDNCRQSFDEGDMIEHDGEYFCDSCYHDLYASCEGCGGVFAVDNVEYIDLSRRCSGHYCDSCIDDVAPQCDDCRERYDANYGSTNTSGRGICDSCAEDYFCCDGCGETCHTDQYSEDGFCNDCYSDRNPASIMSYGEDVLDHTTPPDGLNGLRFGFEIEIECEGYTNPGEVAETLLELHSDYIICKSDGSLHHGLEIVTTPASFETMKDILRKVCKTLATIDGITSHNDTCGTHIHLSKAYLSDLQVGKMRAFVADPANYDFVTCIAQRKTRGYCQYDKMQAKAGKGKKCEPERRLPINCHPHATIEFRIFRGNLRLDRQLKNLEFTQSLANWCNDCSIQDTQTPETFIGYLAKHRKTYPHLVQFLVDKGWMDGKAIKSATLPVVQNVNYSTEAETITD
jgi:hypothetical protein